MAIDNNAASDAFYAAFKAQLGWNPGADDNEFRDAWRAGFGAFLDYIKTNAEIIPNTFAAETGIPVAVNPATGIGATTDVGPLQGVGKVT